MDTDHAKEFILKCREHPELYIEKVLGCLTLEDFQKKLCQYFALYDRLRVEACHAVGKTFLLARLAHSFLNCYPYSKVITTAPTFRQVITLLWGELRKAHKSAATFMSGKLNTNSLTLDDDWFAMGFSPQHEAMGSMQQEQKGSTFQGFHSKYILVIFDEATGVRKDIYTMAEGLLTSGIVVKWVCIGNPTSRASEFFALRKKAEWKTLKIDCFESPNMKANGFHNKQDIEREISLLKTFSDDDRLAWLNGYQKPNPHLINAQWVISKIYDWGFNHPLTLSKIFAEFPKVDDNVIISWDHLQNAFNRDIFDDIPNMKEDRYIGVDVARFGDDLTVITELQGYKWKGKEVNRKEDTVETTGRVIHVIKCGNMNVDIFVCVDGTGVGSGVIDNLNEMKREGHLPRNVYIIEVHFAQAIEHPDPIKEEELKKDFENVKSYMFFQLNTDLRDHIDLPEEEIYQEELPTIRFTYSKRGKLMVESKDEYKARIGKSPDSSDSLALANFGRYIKFKSGTFAKKQMKPSRTTLKNGKKEYKSGIKIVEY